MFHGAFGSAQPIQHLASSSSAVPSATSVCKSVRRSSFWVRRASFGVLGSAFWVRRAWFKRRT
jgi:hypothetical protein